VHDLVLDGGGLCMELCWIEGRGFVHDILLDRGEGVSAWDSAG